MRHNSSSRNGQVFRMAEKQVPAFYHLCYCWCASGVFTANATHQIARDLYSGSWNPDGLGASAFLFPVVRIQEFLADPEAFRGHFHKLIVFDDFEELLQAEFFSGG